MYKFIKLFIILSLLVGFHLFTPTFGDGIYELTDGNGNTVKTLKLYNTGIITIKINDDGFYQWGTTDIGEIYSGNNNAWGGSGDIIVTGYDSGNPRNERRGPCEEGYHVPSRGEWSSLTITWCALKGKDCSDLTNINDEGLWSDFMNEFNISENSIYWSSSPSNNDDNAYNFYITDDSIHFSESARTNSYAVRCVKDSVKYPDTVQINFEYSGFYSNLEIIRGNKLDENMAPNINKEGYIEGRFLSGEKFDFDTPINGDITLNAEWTPINYTIIFSGNTDDVELNQFSINIEYDSGYIVPDNYFTKTGYRITSWNTQANGEGTGYNTGLLQNLTTTSGDIITLYAQWAPNRYTIRYITLDNTIYSTETMEYGAAINYFPHPYRNCYSFLGRNNLPKTMPAHDITVEAKWEYTCGGGGGGGTTTSSKSRIYLTANKQYLNTDEHINLDIETNHNYVGRLNLSVKYKSLTSSTWSTISNNSSTYFSDYSYERSNGYYDMKSSDHGEVTLNNLVKFKKSGYYKIYVDDYYILFTVNSKNNNIQLSTSPSYPNTYDWINLTITTDEDYGNEVIFSQIQYKDNNSSSRTEISNVSSTYISDYSSVWYNGYYTMTSYDNGKAILKNLVKFKKSGYYKIYVIDIDGNESYVQFYIDQLSENTNTNSDEYDIEEIINSLLSLTTGNYNDESITNQNNKIQENTHSSAEEIIGTGIIYSGGKETFYYTGLDEIYISRSCKPYTIQYIETLNAYTSPDLKKTEYFINADYFKRYIDSKNTQNTECYTNRSWITNSYSDTYTGTDRTVAPNGKIYFIEQQNDGYSSKQLDSAKKFPNIDDIKSFINKHNPLTKIK